MYPNRNRCFGGFAQCCRPFYDNMVNFEIFIHISRNLLIHTSVLVTTLSHLLAYSAIFKASGALSPSEQNNSSSIRGRFSLQLKINKYENHFTIRYKCVKEWKQAKTQTAWYILSKRIYLIKQNLKVYTFRKALKYRI